MFGVVLTLVVMGFAYYSLFHWPSCSVVGPCKSNWDFLRFDANPNEIGDMLAGFAGALAFIWIVVTVMLQATELREQREQFKKMADAQEAQVGLLVKQGEIFEKEQKQRSQEGYKDVLDQMLVGIWYRMTTVPLSFVFWSIPEDCYEDAEYSDMTSLFGLPETDDVHNDEGVHSAAEREGMIRQQALFLENLVETLKQCRPFMDVSSLPEKPKELDILIRELGDTRSLEKIVSAAQWQRIQNLQLAETHFHLRTISENKEWWSEPEIGELQ